ncbi:MAG TPA: VIT domain-containing protein, partial [Phycisphaerae bacterium]|nr:VIT domain-containing protein [Phycisphaerae bacterium]
MNARHRIVITALAVCAVALPALADGMIVPVRPDLRVRGAWAVKYHHVDIRVRDQVASVSIDQAFVNTGKGMIEVEYFFPVPPGAAIDSMTLMVDGKEFAAKLLKADEARKIYEDTVRRMKDPALLEYAGFGLYRTRAFPLQPGKPARVLVTYKNVCRKDRDIVEVWYPLNTEKFSSKPLESVEVKVDIKSKADITAVYSPTHDLDVKRDNSQHVVATYKAKEALPVTDFQVYYKAGEEAVGAILMSHRPEEDKDGYFMLLVSPNPRTARQQVVPKDVVVVFDHSGSMGGEKLSQAKTALAYVLKNLNKEDRFNVIAYSDGVERLYSGLVGISKAAEAVDRIDSFDAGGGTDIHGALQAAMKVLQEGRKDEKAANGRPAYVIFLTDGEPTIGKTDEGEILSDTKKANVVGARIFAFGVGYEPNVRLLDKLVEENGGRSDYLKPKEPIETKVSSLYNKIKNPVMTGLKINISNLKLRDMYPRELGDLFDGDQLLVVGRYDGKDASSLPGLEAGVHHAQLAITGMYEGKQRGFEYGVSVRSAGKDERYAFVEKVWAVRRIGYLLDEIQLRGKSQEVIDEIVRLSLKHGIMTPYTSFLAEEKTRLAGGERIRQTALDRTSGLSRDVTGAAGQQGAANRAALKSADRPSPQTAPGAGQAAGYGYASKDDYEKGKKNESVANV